MAKNILINKDDTGYLNAVFNSVPQGVIVCNRSGTIIDINHFASDLFGYSKEEIAGKKINNILFPFSDPVKSGLAVDPKCKDAGFYTGIRKNGTQFLAELRINNYREGKYSNSIYFINVHRADEDDSKNAKEIPESFKISTVGDEKEIADNHLKSIIPGQSAKNGLAFQKAILDYAGVMIIVTDVNGLIKFINRQTCVSTGYSESELVNKKSPMTFHDKNEISKKRDELFNTTGLKVKDDFSAFVAKAEKGIHEEEEFTYIRKDKTKFPVSLTVTAVKDDQGNIIGFMGVAVDISERRKAEDELRSIKELFLQLLKKYPDGIVSIIDNDYRFVYTGGELHDRLNADQLQLLGTELLPNFPPLMRNLVREKLKIVFSTGISISNLELPEPIAGGIYILDAFPLMGNDGVVEKAGLVIRNITSLKQKEIELRKALEKERGLGELKSRFVSMASHEFRTPLSTILSSAYLVEKYATTDDQPKRERHIQRIVSAVNLLTDILNDFLSLGKIEEGKIEPKYTRFHLKEIIAETIREIEPSLKKGQKIKYFHEGNQEVFLDLSILKFILLNLVSNARKFSPENSLIEIKTNHHNGLVVLRVKDHGIGISKQDQTHLMERFFRGTNAMNIQGTGLGLNIVSKYVEMMQGSVSFDSELEKGTEFIITLQCKSPDNEKDINY